MDNKDKVRIGEFGWRVISPDLGGPSPYYENAGAEKELNLDPEFDKRQDEFDEERELFRGRYGRETVEEIAPKEESPSREIFLPIPSPEGTSEGTSPISASSPSALNRVPSLSRTPEKIGGELLAGENIERIVGEGRVKNQELMQVFDSIKENSSLLEKDRRNLANLVRLSKYLNSKESVLPFARAYKVSQDKVIDILDRLRSLPRNISNEMRTESYKGASEEILDIYKKIRRKDARYQTLRNIFGKTRAFLKERPSVVAGIVGTGLIWLGATQGWKALTYSAKKVPDAVEYVVDAFKEDGSGERIESSGKSLDDKVSAPVAKSAPTRSVSAERKVDSSSRGVKLPRKGIYEGVSEGKELEYNFTYDEKEGRTELFIEDRNAGVNYLLVDTGDAKTLKNYKCLSPDELTLDELVVIDNNDRHKYFLRRSEVEELEIGNLNRRLFADMQRAFRQIYNYLGENPK